MTRDDKHAGSRVPAYHDNVSSRDYPPWSGEPAGPDILEQGGDRPPARWRLAFRWRRPPAAGIIFGLAGLLAGLAAGYAAGTLHAGKATTPSGQSGAAASPTGIAPIPVAGAPSQIQLRCPAPAGATGAPRQLDTPVTIIPTTAPHGSGTVVIIPSAGLKVICR